MPIQRDLHVIVDQLLDDNPKVALAAYWELATTQLPWLERRAVLNGRAAGMSWAAIGRYLCRSRQAVIARFGDQARHVTLEQAPPRPVSVNLQQARASETWWVHHQRWTRLVREADEGAPGW